jgi:two-component sensor histidine kinase
MKACFNRSLRWRRANILAVRTPLNAIINYLEIALEGPLDIETRENLARSHSASKSLIYVINDLLDLTRTEEGRDLIKDEVFDLRQVIYEATNIFRADAERKKISFEVVEYSNLPSLVKGDPVRLRQVVSNVTANAVKHTTQGGLKIEIWAGGTKNGKCDVEIAIEDSGEGISPSKLDTLFGEFEQIHIEEENLDILTGAQEESATFTALSKIPGQKVLGLGLAVVARAIRNMNGQLRLKSEEGKGSRFTICVPFTLPPDESPGEATVKHLTPSPTQGEVTLVQSSGMPLSRPPSSEEARSNPLGNTSSSIDRFVNAISSPASLGSPSTATEYFSARPNSTAAFGHPTPNRPAQPARPVSEGPIMPKFGAPVIERFRVNEKAPGQKIIHDSMVPVRPVRLPHQGQPVPSGAAVPLPPPPSAASPTTTQLDNGQKFTVLVAEDDPINSKIMKKRLERMGHVVDMTANGEECMHNFEKACAEYDAVLMDMQVCFHSIFF